MPPLEPSAGRGRIDWRSSLALAWALVFGALYARMLVERKLPAAAAIARKTFGLDREIHRR